MKVQILIIQIIQLLKLLIKIVILLLKFKRIIIIKHLNKKSL